MQPALPWKTYWFLSFTGSLMPSIGQTISRSVWAFLAWSHMRLFPSGNDRPWAWDLLVWLQKCVYMAIQTLHSGPIMRSTCLCIPNKRYERMKLTPPPLTFNILSPPPLHCGSIPLCICSVLNHRSDFTVKTHAILQFIGLVSWRQSKKLFELEF